MKKQIQCHPKDFIRIGILIQITNYFHMIHEGYALILALTAAYCKRGKLRRETILQFSKSIIEILLILLSTTKPMDLIQSCSVEHPTMKLRLKNPKPHMIHQLRGKTNSGLSW